MDPFEPASIWSLEELIEEFDKFHKKKEDKYYKNNRAWQENDNGGFENCDNNNNGYEKRDNKRGNDNRNN